MGGKQKEITGGCRAAIPHVSVVCPAGRATKRLCWGSCAHSCFLSSARLPERSVAMLRSHRSLLSLSWRVGQEPHGHSRATKPLPAATQTQPVPMGAAGEWSLPIPESWCGQMPFGKTVQASGFSNVAMHWQKPQNAWRNSLVVSQWARAMGHSKDVSGFTPQVTLSGWIMKNNWVEMTFWGVLLKSYGWHSNVTSIIFLSTSVLPGQ